MTSIQFYFPLLLALLVASCSPSNNENIPIVKASSEAVNNLEAFALPGANVLAFGPDQVLFIGDSKGAMVRAIATSATAQQDPVPYNLKGLSKRIAEKLDIVPANLIINDMKIHPLSQEAYIAVKKGHQPSAPSFIAIVRPQDGQINLLNYAEATKSEVALVNPVNPDYTQAVYRVERIDANTSRFIFDMQYRTKPALMGAMMKGQFRQLIDDYAVAIEHYISTGEQVTKKNFKTIRKLFAAN